MSPNEPVMVGKDAVRPWLEGYVEAYETHWDKPVQVRRRLNGSGLAKLPCLYRKRRAARSVRHQGQT